MREWAAVLVVSAGCAQGGRAVSRDADTQQPLDGTIENPIDAADDATPPTDAIVDAKPIDAPPPPPDAAPPDAYQCVVMTRQLLVNPVFDLTPIGTGWTQTNIDNAYPAITGDDGVVEQSAPYKAWMGGFSGSDIGASSATDVVSQDVTIPAGTTQLVLTGYYEVRTGETGTTVYDTAQVGLTQTNGTPIETALAVSNVNPTTAWTAFSKTFTTNLSGQTVRVRLTTTNDIVTATSFYFDTLALTATYCQ